MTDLFLKGLAFGLGISVACIITIAEMATWDEINRWWRMRGVYEKHDKLRRD